MKIYTINQRTKERTMLIDDDPIKQKGYDPVINFLPGVNVGDIVITCDDKEYHKKINEIEIICNRPGEMQELNKYLLKMKIDAINRQKYFKRAGIFYNNFKYDIPVISKIVHDEEDVQGEEDKEEEVA